MFIEITGRFKWVNLLRHCNKKYAVVSMCQRVFSLRNFGVACSFNSVYESFVRLGNVLEIKGMSRSDYTGHCPV